MGLYDREYVRVGPRSSSGIGALPMWSCNTWLIVINVTIFVLDAVLYSGFGISIPTTLGVQQIVDEQGAVVGLRHVRQNLPPIESLLHFSTAKAFLFFTTDLNHTVWGLEVWRFLGFQFLHDHGSIMHLLFNMIGLYFFGGLVERYLGGKRYIAFYLLCGVCGALMYLLLNLLGGVFGVQLPGVLFNDPYTPLIGASAGVFGVLLAAAFIAPNAILLFMFVLPMRLATAVYIFVALDMFYLLTGASNAGGSAAHLGGAAAGWWFIRHTGALREFLDIFGRSKHKGPKGPGAPGDGPTRGRARGGAPSQDEVDRILAKVASRGLHSLSAGEKKTLRRATESQRRG